MSLPPSTPGWPYYLELIMDSCRRLVQSLWVRILYLSGGLWWARRELHRQGAIVILTFHRVLDDRSFSQTNSLPNIIVRKETFERLARYVSRRYETVDVQREVPGMASDRLRIGFTFDDGWQDSFEHAFPVLKDHGIPATIFLCTGLTGRDTPFWPEQVYGTLYQSLRHSYGQRAGRLVEALIESLKYGSAEARESHLALLLQQTGGEPAAFYDSDSTMSWEQIIEMRRHGIAFGSHSHTHQILTSVILDRAKTEICTSKLAMEAALNEPCFSFAYPNGDWCPEIRDLLEECGYRLAFTTEREAWLRDTDRLSIPRSNVQQEDLIGLTGRFSAAMFEYATFWKVWLNLRRAQKRAATTRPSVVAGATAQEMR